MVVVVVLLALLALPIDRAFVAGLGIDHDDTELVKAVIGIGHALHLTTIAEGVETEDQHDLLVEFGCQQAQGFLYGRPTLGT